MNLAVSDILGFLGSEGLDCEYLGDSSAAVSGFCSLKRPKPGSITWIKLSNPITSAELNREFSLLIVVGRAWREKNTDKSAHNFIVCDDPKRAFFSILERFWGQPQAAFISTASVIETADIGANVSIGHNCFIGRDVVIGDNVVIGNNVSIEGRVSIGEHTVIQSGAVIGTDGFGVFKGDDKIPKSVRHFGGVHIGRHVVIGANTCIDRGTLDDTIIEDHVKIDNLCHIGHNVHIKERAIVTSTTTFAGSSEAGEDTHFAPGSTVMNGITIGNGSFVGIGAVVIKPVGERLVVSGNPARALNRL